MNSLILSAFLFFVSNIACSNLFTTSDSPYFEGTVTYRGDFIRKTDKYDSVTLALIAGDVITLYARQGNYLTKIGTGITTRLLYRKDENKIYRERFNSDSVYWTRCDKPAQKILNFTKKVKVRKILNIDCDELKVFYENKTVTYYYNSDTLRINPDWSKNSTSYNEDFYAREMKSISLKTIIEYKDFIMIQTAIKIAPQKVDLSVFEIPHKPLVEDK